MTPISEQIRLARKARNMTQDELADQMFVSRSAVAHWESGRSQPSAEALLQLSKVLEYSFEAEGSAGPAAAEAEPQPAPQAEARPGKKRRGLLIGIAAAAVVILAACLILIPRLRAQQTPLSIAGTDGNRWQPADYQQITPNDPAKAYLTIATTTERKPNAEDEQLSYRFIAREDNGIGFSITRTETVIFLKDLADPMILSAEDYNIFDIETDLAPYGTFVHQGGLSAIQPRGWIGIGYKIIGVDENGNEEAFTAFLPVT